MAGPRDRAGSRRNAETAEAAHWDAIASEHGDTFVARAEASTNDPVHDAHARALGDLSGRRVLDLGCGMGLWTTAMAGRGADVCAMDISPASVDATRKRAERLGLSRKTAPLVGSAHALPFRDGAFDAVSGHLILHHLDAGLAGREVARVLRRDGRAVFTENSARSGMLMFARRFVCGRFGIPKWSTPGEYPLRRCDLRRLSAPFSRMRVEHPRFDWFFLLDAKLFGFRNLRASRILSFLDHPTTRIAPFMRKLAYYQVVILDR